MVAPAAAHQSARLRSCSEVGSWRDRIITETTWSHRCIETMIDVESRHGIRVCDVGLGWRRDVLLTRPALTLQHDAPAESVVELGRSSCRMSMRWQPRQARSSVPRLQGRATQMTQGMRLSDLAKLAEPEQQMVIAGLARIAKAGGSPAARAIMRSKIRVFESRYEMTSSEMLKKFRAGEIRETADISKWLFLISVRDCHVTQA